MEANPDVASLFNSELESKITRLCADTNAANYRQLMMFSEPARLFQSALLGAFALNTMKTVSYSLYSSISIYRCTKNTGNMPCKERFRYSN